MQGWRRSRAHLHASEKLVNLRIRHLLSKLGEDVSQFAYSDKAITLLVKNLETANEFL